MTNTKKYGKVSIGIKKHCKTYQNYILPTAPIDYIEIYLYNGANGRKPKYQINKGEMMCQEKISDKIKNKIQDKQYNIMPNTQNNIPQNNIQTLYTNVNKLNTGEITYKELCEILQQPYYKGGNQKKKQLIEFSRFFNFEQRDRKIYIKEIYETPKEKEYRYPANAIYIECIEKILMTYLSNQKDHITYISSQYLYWTLGMVNRDYIEMQRPDQKEVLKQALRKNYEWTIEEVPDKSVTFYINDFYSRCRGKFSDIIDNSLKSLQKRRLIEYSNVYHMYFEIEENGCIIEKYDTYSNDAETKDIMTIEREVLDLYGYENESEVWLHRIGKEYYKEIIERAKELYPGLKGIYRCYKFLFDKNNIKNALTRDEEKRKKKELNGKIIKFIDEQTEKNYLSTVDAAYGEFKYTRKYEQAQYYLSNRLIKIKE